MDPDETLRILKDLVREAITKEGQLDHTDAVDLLSELAQHFYNLDSWMMNGGFLPKAWRSK